jgi:plastocyanin
MSASRALANPNSGEGRSQTVSLWKFLIRASLVTALAVGAFADLAAPANAADTAAVIKIDNFTFGPPTLTVPVGTTVTWVNEDDIPHTVAATDRLFKSKALDTDDRFTYTFSAPGSFEYFCSLHPHMVGTVIVQPAPSP